MRNYLFPYTEYNGFSNARVAALLLLRMRYDPTTAHPPAYT
jgi:hypothetical protein